MVRLVQNRIDVRQCGGRGGGEGRGRDGQT